jgi:hypothetical protein
MALTHDDMRRTVERGEGVLYQGRVITKVAELPSAAALAAGNPQAEAAARTSLEAQIADLQAQVARLQAPAPSNAAAETPTHYVFLADEGTWKKGDVVPAGDLGDAVAKFVKAKTIKAVPPPAGA